MKRTFRFAKSIGTVRCEFSSGQQVDMPVIPGILKHPTPEMLPVLLRDPAVARKYTIEALRSAAWPILVQFPREWLKECLDRAGLRPSRKKALAFLLS